MEAYKHRAALLAAQQAIKSADRLYKTQKTSRPKILAIDMDGTILNHPENDSMTILGKPLPGVQKKLKKLKELGWIIVVWSVRAETPEIIQHLKKYEIPFDYYNWHPFQPKGGGAKILADVYLDDRALTFSNLTDIDQVLVFKPWWKN